LNTLQLEAPNIIWTSQKGICAKWNKKIKEQKEICTTICSKR
jgi:hypothetical protein